MNSKTTLSFAKNQLLQTVMLIIMAVSILGCKSKIKDEPELSATINTIDTAGFAKLPMVTFLPYWVTNAQFAGYYVAVETGIYRKYGFNVTVIPYRPFLTPKELINEGKADFAALWLANAIELKSSGSDIVNIAQPSTRSSLMLVAKKKSGIRTLQDLNGKKAGIWSGFEIQPKALFSKYNLDVKIIPIGSTNNLFLMDGVDVTNANWFDEYHSMINSGYNADELVTFFYADYGLNFLEDGIYCLSDKLKNNPKLCADFVTATLEGWKYAFENPEFAIDIVVKYSKETNQPVNRVHQRWMLDRYKDLYFSNVNKGFNTNLSIKDYQFVGNVLKESGLIKEVPAFDQFYQPVLKK